MDDYMTIIRSELRKRLCNQGSLIAKVEWVAVCDDGVPKICVSRIYLNLFAIAFMLTQMFLNRST